MNKTELIHIARQPFYIEQPAYKKLQKYLDSIKKHYDEQEIVDDIERSVAEKLAAKSSDKENVVLEADIDEVIEQLGTITDITSDEKPAEHTTQPATKRIFRDMKNAQVAGVSAGLAAYFGIDVVLIRVAFVLATIFGSGLGIVVYIILWIAIPEAETLEDEYSMQGVPQTLHNIEETVRTKASELTSGDSGDRLKAGLHAFSEIAAAIVLFAVRVFGGLIVFVGGALLIGVTTTFGAILAGAERKIFSPAIENFPNNAEHYALMISGWIFTTLLLALVLQLGLSMARLKNTFRPNTTVFMIVAVVVSASLFGTLGLKNANSTFNKIDRSVAAEQIDVEEFTSIELSDQLIASFKPGEEYSVEITGPDFARENYTAEVKDGTLTIQEKKGFGSTCFIFCFADTTVVITAPADKFDQITLKDQSTFNGDELSFDSVYLHDQSDIFLSEFMQEDALSLELHDQSSASFDCEMLPNLNATLRDQSDLDADDCEVMNADLYLYDQSDALVYVRDSLSIESYDQSEYTNFGSADSN